MTRARTPSPQPRPPSSRPSRQRTVIEPAPGFTEPAPWGTRAIAVLCGLVVLLLALVAFAFYLSDRRLAYPEYLVGLPYQPLPLLFIVSFLVTMPLAQRIVGEPRPMRLLESLSVAAIAILVILALGGLGINLGKQAGGYRGEIAALGVAELAALAVTAIAYPRIYRRFWMPRRGPRSR